MASFYLDHLTVVDATPLEVIALAESRGYDGVCLFMNSLPDLPRMPAFDLITDRAARRAVVSALAASGQKLGLVYPFTLSGRSVVADFDASLDCAAALGAQAVNLLVYDRDKARRAALFAAFCALATGKGLGVALEFYPASRIPSLAEAVDLMSTYDGPGRVGLTIDLLHLMRSHGRFEDVAALPADHVLFAQLADGPATRPESEWQEEASHNRALMGDGDFDGRRFLASLPSTCPVSLEVPRPAGALTDDVPTARDLRALLMPS